MSYYGQPKYFEADGDWVPPGCAADMVLYGSSLWPSYSWWIVPGTLDPSAD